MKRGLLLALFAMACGDGATAEPIDGGTIDADARLPFSGRPELPVPPQANGFACPSGWIRFEMLHDVFCDAFDGYSQSTCPWPARQRVGTGGVCERVGRGCSESLPDVAERRWFVANGAADGDGSEGAPFGQISEAIEASSEGERIVLAPGSYDLENTLELRDRTLEGRCAGGVVLNFGELFVGLSLSGSAGLSNVALDGGLMAIRIHRGADATVEDVLITGAEETAISVDQGASASLSHVSLRSSTRGAGQGLRVSGRAEAEDLRVVGFAGWQVEVNGAAAELHLVDSSVGSEAYDEGFLEVGEGGVHVLNGAHATLERVHAEHFLRHALRVADSGSNVEVRDSSFIAVPASQGTVIEADRGGHLHLQRSSAHFGAVVLHSVGEGSLVEAEDGYLTFGADTVDRRGYGVSAVDSGEIRLRRMHVQGSVRHELHGERGGRLLVEDSVLGGTSASLDGAVDVATVGLRSGARAELRRVVIRDSAPSGVLVSDASLLMEDVRIEELRPSAFTGYSAAIHGENGAEIEGERVELIFVPYAGMIFDTGAQGRFRELRISRVYPSRCMDRQCREFLGGVGVAVLGDASLELERFLLERAELVGLQMSPDDAGTVGSVDLRQGLLRHSEVGINVQAPDYDLNRLLDEVLLEHNGRNLDGETLPIVFPEL